VPNIIHELTIELARVQALLGQLNGEHQEQANRLLRYGSQSMALNRYEEMREALDDLREFGRPKKEVDS
jgi:hypothetical protein